MAFGVARSAHHFTMQQETHSLQRSATTSLKQTYAHLKLMDTLTTVESSSPRTTTPALGFAVSQTMIGVATRIVLVGATRTRADWTAARAAAYVTISRLVRTVLPGATRSLVGHPIAKDAPPALHKF